MRLHLHERSCATFTGFIYKKIRTEEKTWEQIESYITRQSDVLFSHTICPSCRVAHFGDTKTKPAVPVVNRERSLL